MSTSTIFITYDGLTDPLGASQILPYIRSIASHPRKVHVLSFEKPDRFKLCGARLSSSLAEEGISWTPLSFSKGGKLAKAWDLCRMHAVAIWLAMRFGFRIVHCRSYQAAQVGRQLKRLFGVKLLFDMRGLWVDERVDGGLWDLNRFVDRWLFRYYKWVERQLLQSADHVVVLTEMVVPELHRLAPNMTAEVSVIPCCSDFDHFKVLALKDRDLVRESLDVPKDAFLIAYLGSLGTWYCLREMLEFFRASTHHLPNAHLLLITRDWGSESYKLFLECCGEELSHRLHVRPADRAEVPKLIGAADIMLSFIKPAYSKIASSPTKLAEALACGVPVVCNAGVGDIESQVKELNAGEVFDIAEPQSLQRITGRLGDLVNYGGPELRERARAAFDLSVAAAAYRRIYDQMVR